MSKTRNAKSDDGNGILSARRNSVSGQDSTSARTFHATSHKRGCECERNRSRGFTVVVLQDTSESMFTFDLVWIERDDVVIRFTTRQRQQLIVQSLMWPALIIIGHGSKNRQRRMNLVLDVTLTKLTGRPKFGNTRTGSVLVAWISKRGRYSATAIDVVSAELAPRTRFQRRTTSNPLTASPATHRQPT